MIMRNTLRSGTFLLLLAVATNSPGQVERWDDRLDSIMFQDPTLPRATSTFRLDDKLKGPWSRALNHPDRELHRLAADTISLAHRYGMRDWDDVTARLAELVSNDDADPSVQRAAANALVTLDVQQAAEMLAEHAQETDLDLSELIEPALARWDYEPMRAIWLARLSDSKVERLRLLLAIEALGIVREARAKEPLLQIVQDPAKQPPVRLAAARALALIDAATLVGQSRDLASSGELLDRVLAVTLLQEHGDSMAIEVLKSLAADRSDAVSGAALGRLFDIDPRLVDEFVDDALQRKDVNLRRIAAQTLVTQASSAAIAQLGPLLDDRNPRLRRYVADRLVEFGSQEPLTKAVREACMQELSESGWRGIEQSAIVLGTLDHEPAGPRLVDLLRHPRPEVQAATAWSLRQLSVPALFPVMLQFAQEQYDIAAAGNRPNFAASFQIGQVMQTFGQTRYLPAEPLMRKLVSKAVLQYGQGRPGAIWSLGYIHEGNPPEGLAKQLVGRLADVESLTPEQDELRAMSAIALARMKAESELDALRAYAPETNMVGAACLWAIEQLTGEPAPPPTNTVWGYRNWFLMPQGE